MKIARAKAHFQVMHDLESLLLGFSGTPAIECFVFMPKGKTLGTRIGA